MDDAAQGSGGGDGCEERQFDQSLSLGVAATLLVTGNHIDEDLMTRRQVASLFRVTSAAVMAWARRGRLPEGPQPGRSAPGTGRADVEALVRSGVTRGRDLVLPGRDL